MYAHFFLLTCFCEIQNGPMQKTSLNVNWPVQKTSLNANYVVKIRKKCFCKCALSFLFVWLDEDRERQCLKLAKFQECPFILMGVVFGHYYA